jgi:4'-phosphopantetheinyl transferase
LSRLARDLPASAVHVWHADLDLPGARFEALAETLSADERARAHRLLDGRAAARYVAARGLLRELIGGYLAIEPGSVRLDYREHGKPCLPAPEPLHFNVTHAGGRVLMAFSATGRVGVDMERIRPLAHAERIARRAFTPREVQQWTALEEDRRLPGFFELWTRMESLAKLHGHGVWRLLAEREGAEAGIRFHALRAPAGYCAVLAADHDAGDVVEREYPGEAS